MAGMAGMVSVVHGGLDPREIAAMGLDPASVVDLSANLHRDGISPTVRAALESATWDRYPPADAAPLREAIAAHEGVPPEMVLPVAGATGGIHLLARCFAPGQDVAVLGPTFGEYRAAIEAAGGRAIAIDAGPPAFAPPIDRIPRAALGFLCNPNNPTGAFLVRDEVERAATRLGGLLVLDVAYEPFTAPRWNPVDLVRAGVNVAVLRSMTKLHAMPGVRLGYLVASAEVIARLAALQPAWTLDAAAHAAGLVALTETEDRVTALDAMRATRDALRQSWQDAGLAVAPSQANFLTVRVGSALRVREDLARRGFLVRDCTSFGLPEWVRLSVPRSEQAERLAAALIAVTR